MEKRNLDLSLKAKYDSGICKLFSYTIKEAKLRKLVEHPNEEGSSQIFGLNQIIYDNRMA